MKNYLIYDGSGRIIQTGVVPDSMLELQGDPDNGRYVKEGVADGDTQYVLADQLVGRPVSPALASATSVRANGVDEVMLWQVPAGARISVQGPQAMSGTADGSNVILTFATPGSYVVRIEQFPYQDKEVSINAV